LVAQGSIQRFTNDIKLNLNGGAVMTLPVIFGTLYIVLVTMGCKTSSSEVLTEDVAAPGAPLRNNENACLVPSLLHKKRVMAVPCDGGDRSQNWHYDESSKILRSVGDGSLAWLVKGGQVLLPQTPGGKSMMLADESSNDTAIAVLVPEKEAEIVEQPLNPATKQVGFNERESLSPGGRVLFRHGKSEYSLSMVRVRDRRCPIGAFCFVSLPAHIHFSLVAKGAEVGDAACKEDAPTAPHCAIVKFFNYSPLPLKTVLGRFQILVDSLSPEGYEIGKPLPVYKVEIRITPAKPQPK
jgi:hypothetical protein